jgi:hypothetical protein
MTDSKTSNRPDRPDRPDRLNRSNRRAHRPFGCRALLFATTLALGLVAVPAVAQAATHKAPPPPPCSVSARAVSEIVGYSVPTGTVFDDNLKPTKANDEISAVVKSCIFGSETSLAALTKDVVISYEVTSKPLTGKELQHALIQAEALKFTFTPYRDFRGMKAFYFNFAVGGTSVQGLAAIDGTKIYSAALYTTAPATSELAALARLAKQL